MSIISMASSENSVFFVADYDLKGSTTKF